LVYIYQDHRETLDLILLFIDIELGSTAESTLFRNNSLVTKMFKYYAKVIGADYLFNLLKTYVEELETINNTRASRRISTGKDIEMQDQSQTSNHVDSGFAHRVFNAILNSSNDIPTPLLSIFAHIKRSVAERYPGAEYRSISSFFFMRFIVSALSNPQSYGLLEKKPEPSLQRQLTLLSQTLQNLASGTRFGNAEDQVVKMNSFISDNTQILQNFYNILKAPSTLPMYETVPQAVKSNSLIWIHSHICLSISKLNKELETCEDFDNGAEVKSLLEGVLDSLGPPAKKK